MLIFKLIFFNLLRHPIRVVLTIFGLIVATLSYGLLSTVVDAWYAGAEGASNARLIVRSSTSLIFPIPMSHLKRIEKLEGVNKVSWSRWFGGVYKEPKNFFPQFAVDPESYLTIYPEYLVADVQKESFFRDKRSTLIGRKIADEHNLKVGDLMVLDGQIFPGKWEFKVAGIYDGKDSTTDTAQMFFHWGYLNEEIKKRSILRDEESVGVFIVEIKKIADAARISVAIDELFKNSVKETYTETEKAFQLGFVAMTEAIVVAIRLVSYVVILIIMAVMANTMSMTSRERIREYATIRAIGFSPLFLIKIIFMESLFLSIVGGVFGVALTFPAAYIFSSTTGTLFPVFEVSQETVIYQIFLVILTGLVSSLFPSIKASNINITSGLRSI
ncbi:MAG: ABC transporter permease [Burkholderiaceae bacterium]